MTKGEAKEESGTSSKAMGEEIREVVRENIAKKYSHKDSLEQRRGRRGRYEIIDL